jgi:hypothetical protein
VGNIRRRFAKLLHAMASISVDPRENRMLDKWSSLVR